MATKKQEVMKSEDSAVAALYDAEVDTGFENTSADDYAIPFIKLLQKMSPEVDKDDAAYVEGAESGMFLNTATGALSQSIDVVPCHYRHAIIEWAGDEPGSGFVGQHDPGYEAQFERQIKNGGPTGKYVTPEGHVLQDTRYFFCIDPETTEPFIISFASTQIKKAKNWMTQMQYMKFTAKSGERKVLPMFANIYRISSKKESKDQYIWSGYAVERLGPVTDPDLAQAAKDARDMFRASSDNVKPPESAAPATSGDDSDIPF